MIQCIYSGKKLGIKNYRILREEKEQIMEPRKPSKAFSVLSIISMVFTGLGMVSLFMIVFMYMYAGSGGGSGTAVTNEAILGIIGIFFFVVIGWIFGGIGGVMGLILTIIGLAKKYFSRVWMPGISLVLGSFPIVIPILILYIGTTF